MKILYVTASNLCKNTSANMSHNGYVQGLIENGADLDIIMADDSFGSYDTKLKRIQGAIYYEYKSVSSTERLRRLGRNLMPEKKHTTQSLQRNLEDIAEKQCSHIKNSMRSFIKTLFLTCFRPDPIYPLDAYWLKNAMKFKNEKVIYDYIISNSSPAASHRLVADLLNKRRIKCRKWIQIWEDPWFHDLYGNHPVTILDEEHSLLKDAQVVYYVSPLTLYYQKKFFGDCAEKMHFIPLPFLKFGIECGKTISNNSFGYFGDYYSHTRNLQPFYDALVEINGFGYIYGDSDLHLQDTEQIVVSGRVTLDILEEIQNKVSVLVHVCNLRGGQIPGKIYHYSATTKPILFILDGTEEEQKIIYDYFSKFKRYCFCKNEKQDIIRAMKEMISHPETNKGFVVQDFCPKQIVRQLLQVNA